MNDLDRIVIIFENCDSVSLHKDVLSGFWVSGITEEYSLISNALLSTKRIGESFLGIRKDLVKFTTTNFGSNLLERLEKYKDITHYYLHLTDGSEIKLELPWSGDSAYHNDSEYHYQDSKNVQITYNIKRESILDFHSKKI